MWGKRQSSNPVPQLGVMTQQHSTGGDCTVRGAICQIRCLMAVNGGLWQYFKLVAVSSGVLARHLKEVLMFKTVWKPWLNSGLLPHLLLLLHSNICHCFKGRKAL